MRSHTEDGSCKPDRTSRDDFFFFKYLGASKLLSLKSRTEYRCQRLFNGRILELGSEQILHVTKSSLDKKWRRMPSSSSRPTTPLSSKREKKKRRACVSRPVPMFVSFDSFSQQNASGLSKHGLQVEEDKREAARAAAGKVRSSSYTIY